MNKINLKRCKNCGELNPDNSNVCVHCETRFNKSVFRFYADIISGDFGESYEVVWACPKCRAVNPNANTKCHNCLWNSKGNSWW